MADLEVIQVIHTRLLRKGLGRDETDPVRIIDQYWNMQGELLWEIDPCVTEITAQVGPKRDGR
jgi:hypothetical protein